MSEFAGVPAPCYELLEFLHRNDSLVAYRELPAGLRDIGLVQVCRHHEFIELALWHEPASGGAVSSPPNCVCVVAPASWVPFYAMCRNSLEDAIARDAECGDPKEFLHMELLRPGKLAFYEWRLNGKPRSADSGPGSQVPKATKPRLDRLPGAYKRAYLQRMDAEHQCPAIESDQPGDRHAYTWLKDYRDEGEELLKWDTWRRYMSHARLMLGENNPRAARPHGSSIVPAGQI